MRGKNILKGLKFDFVGLEMDIQNHISENIHDICKGIGLPSVKKVYPQHSFSSKGIKGIIDLLIHHSDNTATIIEVKRYKDDVQLASAIGQVLLYSELCEIHLSGKPRLIIASNFIPNIVLSLIKTNNLNVKTIQVDGDIITYF